MTAALQSMRVLDLTQWESGPSCTQYLAWLGADVLKVEPVDGDPGRRALRTDEFDSQYFCNLNGNKRSVAINLKCEEGLELLRRLVPRSDLLVENQGPDVLERLGMPYTELAGLNSALIVVRIKGYGLSGPRAGWKSFDPLALASSGIMSMTGTPETGPLLPGGTFGDMGAGIHAAFAAVAAYLQRLETGKGQLVEVSMQEAAAMFVRSLASTSWGPGELPAIPRQVEGAPPSGLWRCKGSDAMDYVYIMITNRYMWARFCEAVGQSELVDDERFNRSKNRLTHIRDLESALSPWFEQRGKHEVAEILTAANVPAAAVLNTQELFHDPHLKARGFFSIQSHPKKGDLVTMGSPFRLSSSETRVTRAPILGEHSREILHEVLGLAKEMINDLEERGVVYCGS